MLAPAVCKKRLGRLPVRPSTVYVLVTGAGGFPSRVTAVRSQPVSDDRPTTVPFGDR